MSEIDDMSLKNLSNSNSIAENLTSEGTKYKNNILNYYFNSKNITPEEPSGTEEKNFLENSQTNNAIMRSLSKNDNLNFNYTIRNNNEIIYTPNRTFIEELEYDDILNNNTHLPRTNSSFTSGQSLPSFNQSRVASQKSTFNAYRPRQLNLGSNLFIDYNVRNNLFTNQVPQLESYNSILDRSFKATSNYQPFDALGARRKMFNEMSSSNMALRPQANYNNPPPQNYAPNYAQPAANLDNMFNGTIEGSMSPVANPALGTAAFSETIVSSNVEDLIDVMAKRRLAIKNLENEMNRQHQRGSSLVKSYNPNPSRIDVNSRPPLDIYNPYNDRENTRNNLSYDPQVSFQGRAPVRNLNDPYYDGQKPPNNIISNIEYPSDTNREIYSTYLVDSIKPHYSARRLVSGKPYPSNQTIQPSLSQPNPALNKPIIPNNQSSFIPNYNQTNSQPILENYRQQPLQPIQPAQPVQPIVNNYGPVYNQPLLNPSTDPDLTKRQRENLPNENNLKKISTQSMSHVNSNSLLNQKNASSRQSGLFNGKTQTNPDEHLDSDQAIFENNTPRAARPNFYLSENNASDARHTNRRSRLENDVSQNVTPRENFTNDTFQIDLTKGTNTNNQVTNRRLSETYRIKSKIEHKFPKLYDRQRLFWAAGTIVRFLMRIKIQSQRSSKMLDRTGSASIFRIRLLEIMTAVHRVYLEPEGPIYTSLMSFVRNENDMNALFDPDNLIHKQCIETLCLNVEELVQRITEFMPKEGIVGTTAKSALLSLISEGNKFPDNYFWDEEKERLKFDENGKIRNINRGRAILILMSAMISRGLITTLLIKPIKFRLLRGEIPSHMKINLKILATIMCFIVRKVNNNTEIPLGFPWEWQSSLFNDLRMKPIYKNSDVIFTIDKCKKLFIAWANEYINRLDETAGLTR